MNAYHPDERGFLARDPKGHKPGGTGGQGGEGGGLLSAFMPGDRNALAQQLSFGFGGPPKQYKTFLGQTYSGLPLPQFQYGVHNGNGDGKSDGTGNGTGATPGTPVTLDQNGNVILPPPSTGANPYISFYRQFGAAPMGMR